MSFKKFNKGKEGISPWGKTMSPEEENTLAKKQQEMVAEARMDQEEDDVYVQISKYQEALGEHNKEFIDLADLGQRYVAAFRTFGVDSPEAKSHLKKFSAACRRAAEK